MIRAALVSLATCSLAVVPLADPAVRAESAVWADKPSCDLLVALDGSRNGLLKIDTTGKSTEVALGDFPFDVATSSDGRFAYVSGFRDGVLYVVDLATMSKVATIAVGLGPNGVEVSPDDGKVYVAIAGEVVVVDTATRRVERRITTSNTPYDIVLSPDGNVLYASIVLVGAIDRVDLTTNSTTSVKVPTRPGLLALSPDGSQLFVTHEETNQLTRIDTTTMTAKSVTVGNRPRGVDISPDGRTVYVVDQTSQTLSIVDAAALTRRTVAVGEGAYDVTLDASGSRAYVDNYWNNSVSIVDTSTAKVVGTLSLGTGSEPWNMATVCPPPSPFTRPGTVNDLSLFANFFCGPCTSAWVLFTRPAGATDFEVIVDGRRATCVEKGYFFDLALCRLASLTPGRALTLGVVPLNGTIRGRTATTSLTLNR